jgi:hypothetical protein
MPELGLIQGIDFKNGGMNNPPAENLLYSMGNVLADRIQDKSGQWEAPTGYEYRGVAFRGNGTDVYGRSNYIPQLNDTLECRMKFNATATLQAIGIIGTGGNRYFFGVNVNQWVLGIGSAVSVGGGTADTNWHTFKIEGKKLYVDGVMIIDLSANTGEPTRTMSILAGTSGDATHDNYCNADLAWCKITRGGVLQRHWVATQQSSAYTLYDVSGNKNNITMQGTLTNLIQYNNEYNYFNLYGGNIPIVSDGVDDYINSDIIPSNDIDVEMRGKFNVAGVRAHGSRENDSTNSRFYICGTNGTVFTFGWNALIATSVNQDNNIHTFRINRTGGYIDGVKRADITEDLASITRTIKLFAVDTAGGMAAFTSFAFEYCKIWQGGVLVRNIIPQANGTLLDTVNNGVYANNGTGSLINTYIPKELTGANDSLGTTATYQGRVKNSPKFVDSNCLTFNGVDNSVNITRPTSLTYDEVEFYVYPTANNKYIYDRQTPSSGISISSSNVLTLSAAFVNPIVKINDIVTTAITLNAWNKVNIKCNPITVSANETQYIARTNSGSTYFAGRMAGFCFRNAGVNVGNVQFSGGSGDKVYSTVTGQEFIVAGTLTNIWASTQDVYHANITEGFTAVCSSDGTDDYIDTGIIPNNNTQVEMRCKSNVFATTNKFFGVVNSTNYFFVGYRVSGTNKFYAGNGGSLADIKDYDNNWHSIVLNSATGKASIDGVEYNVGSFAPYNDLTSKIMLFAQGGLAVGSWSNVDMAYCKIWQGGVLVRHFIPLPDGTLLDIVNNVIYKNVGTGTFAYKRIPKLQGANTDVFGTPLSNPKVNGHNNAETKIQFPQTPRLVLADVDKYLYNGTTMEKLSFTDIVKCNGDLNIIPNSRFTDGVTGWIDVQATSLSIQNSALLITGNLAVTSMAIRIDSSMPCVSGRKIYGRMKFRAIDSGFTSVNMGLRGTTSGTSSVTLNITQANSVQNKIYEISGIGEVTSALTGNLRPIISAQATDVNTKRVLVYETVAIDLTAIFGAGNEPTQAFMDANWQNYVGPRFLARESSCRCKKDRMLVYSQGLKSWQLVSNGNFALGTNGWTPVLSTHAVANNTLTNTSTTTGSDLPLPYSAATYNFVSGRRYYLRALMRVTNSNCTSVRMVTNSNDLIAEQVNPVANQWYVVSNVGVSGSNNQLRARHIYPDVSTANGKVMQVQNVVALDLTEIFGAGNEPTKEFMDTNYQKYLTNKAPRAVRYTKSA